VIATAVMAAVVLAAGYIVWWDLHRLTVGLERRTAQIEARQNRLFEDFCWTVFRESEAEHAYELAVAAGAQSATSTSVPVTFYAANTLRVVQ
jgi:hypothetical protein